MTEDQLKKMTEMWGAGVTVKDIAAALGVPRSTVRGAASTHRERFPKRTHDNFRAEGFHAKNINDRAKAVTMKEKWPTKAPGFEGVPVGKLTGCGCMFPLWGHHERFDVDSSLYCGAPKEGEKPYCSFHAAASKGSGTPSERAAVKVLAAA